MVNTAEYQQTLDDLAAQIVDCGQLKDKTQKACEKLVKLLSILGPAAGYITAKEVWEKRDQIFRDLERLLTKLAEIQEGQAAPLTFLKHAQSWKTGVLGSLKSATDSAELSTKLDGYWQGVAADRYGVARAGQNGAIGAAYQMSESIAHTLEELADSGWEYYKSIVKCIGDFLAKAAGAIGKILAVITAPWGLSDMIDLVAAVIKALVDVTTATASQLRDQYKAKLDLESLPVVTKGLPNGVWPRAVTDTYDDATVADGTNAWSVPSDRVQA